MAPFHFPPNGASDLSPTPDAAANKDREAGIVVDDNDVIDVAAEKRLLRQLDLRIIPAFVAIFISAGAASESLVCPSLTIKLLTNKDVLSQGNSIILNADTVSRCSLYLAGGRVLFPIPSNYMLRYFSPLSSLAFIVLGSGASLMVMAASQNYVTVLFFRLLMSAFSIGGPPGVVYFFTFWYRLQERSLRISLILASLPLGAAFSGCIAYGVGCLNGIGGLEGWRWLFLIEGTPLCALAILVYRFLPSYPENATWRSNDDRALAVRRMKQESSKSVEHDKITWDGAKSTLKNGRLYLHYLLSVAFSVPEQSMWLFVPTIVSRLGYEGRDAQLLAVPPLATAFIASVGLSAVADRYRAWSMCILVSFVLAGTTFIVQGMVPATAFVARYVLLCFAFTFTFMPYASMLTWFADNLRDTNGTTLAIPFNMIPSVVGQAIGVCIYEPREAPAYPTGHYTNGAVLLMPPPTLSVLGSFRTSRAKDYFPSLRLFRGPKYAGSTFSQQVFNMLSVA
ncbi:MFS general substrate transporter [Armillaria gallica]|uniref:MFS general substrate transporter n=1 Tax=Armillaria gallica TaxID=47427 RepID=A0A2H3CBM6_ARMGA|nr:MFS general substrate transporter [Armillaria gallica]